MKFPTMVPNGFNKKKVYSGLSLSLKGFAYMEPKNIQTVRQNTASRLGPTIPTPTLSRLLHTYNALFASCVCLYVTQCGVTAG